MANGNFTIERRGGVSSTPRDVEDSTLGDALPGLSNIVSAVGSTLHSRTNGVVSKAFCRDQTWSLLVFRWCLGDLS